VKKHPDAGIVMIPPGQCMEETHNHGFQIVIREDDGSWSYGHGRPMREGEPLMPGMHIALADEHGVLRRVDGLPQSGPAQVATPAYREGWSRTFSN
jgi:hypothetical protein